MNVYMNMRINSEGGIIGPGESIMEIVPRDEPLIAEIKVKPADIDAVEIGSQTRIKLKGYRDSATLELEGTVKNISADLVSDETSRVSFYEVIVEVPREDLALFDPAPRPGMPLDAIIISGKQTPLKMLLKPLLDTIDRGIARN